METLDGKTVTKIITERFLRQQGRSNLKTCDAMSDHRKHQTKATGDEKLGIMVITHMWLPTLQRTYLPEPIS
jgi:hypothetical protein